MSDIKLFALEHGDVRESQGEALGITPHAPDRGESCDPAWHSLNERVHKNRFGLDNSRSIRDLSLMGHYGAADLRVSLRSSDIDWARPLPQTNSEAS